MAGHPLLSRCAESVPDNIVDSGARKTAARPGAAIGHRAQAVPGPILIATKLQAPVLRDQVVPRARLLERLGAARRRGLTVVAGPAGSGKTTLLAGWREVETVQGAVAWLTLDECDNDPVVLWSYVTEALRRACPGITGSASPQAARASVVDAVLRRLVNELSQQDAVTLILDDFHRLSDDAALESLAWFIRHLPQTFHLVLSTRTEPPFPLAAMRARGELLELRSEDLQFTTGEADDFLNGHLGLGLGPEDLGDLVECTEGWPAGLYLAALSLRGSAHRRALIKTFVPSNRHVVDFLVTEVLEAHDPPAQALMMRSSILERLSGPLCDAVTEQQESGATLETLSRTNLFVAPVPRERGWFRFHPLFARVLRAELERREPGTTPALHHRAYAWHREHGTAGAAIQHALEAGAYPEAAGLIEARWVRYASNGEHALVLGWIRRLPDLTRSGSARLLLIEAWALSLAAKWQEAAQVIAALQRLGGLSGGPLPDGFSSAEASLMTLRASFPLGDVGAQLKNARHAAELEVHGSAWRPVACWAAGIALYYRGELSEADRWLAESLELAPARMRLPVDTSALAYRSLIAGERGNLRRQRLLAELATERMQDRGTGEANGTALLALAVSLSARGRPAGAKPVIERGIASLRRSGAQPTDMAMALMHHVSVLSALGDRERPPQLIAEARSILGSCPDAGILAHRLNTLERSLRVSQRPGSRELTRRELRILKLLDSNLSERDVGSELFVSYNTVHSHVRSIYRKLGSSSRSAALKRARELELI